LHSKYFTTALRDYVSLLEMMSMCSVYRRSISNRNLLLEGQKHDITRLSLSVFR